MVSHGKFSHQVFLGAHMTMHLSFLARDECKKPDFQLLSNYNSKHILMDYTFYMQIISIKIYHVPV